MKLFALLAVILSAAVAGAWVCTYFILTLSDEPESGFAFAGIMLSYFPWCFLVIFPLTTIFTGSIAKGFPSTGTKNLIRLAGGVFFLATVVAPFAIERLCWHPR